jgi:hypothetical protein
MTFATGKIPIFIFYTIQKKTPYAMRVFTFLLLLLATFQATAQKQPKFGDIPIEDLTMTSYPADTSAAAVILSDYGTSTIEYSQSQGFKLRFQRTKRIKILQKSGLDWANQVVYLYRDGGEDEKIGGVKGSTYNLVNGKVEETELSKQNIFKEHRDENTDIVKVTFPNVREGSVVEFSYNVVSDFLFNFQDWDFQTTIPTRWSEYKANIPEYFHYDRYMQGYVVLHVNETNQTSRTINLTEVSRPSGGFRSGGTGGQISNNEVRYQEYSYRWVAKDVPAFRIEPYMTTHRDFISQINFELNEIRFPNQPVQTMMGSWEGINKKYYEHLGSEINGNGHLKDLIAVAIGGASSNEEKIASIVTYVKANVNWDGSFRKFLDKGMKKVLDEKSGSSSEVNVLLGSMLEKAGFQVAPVLISTRDHGMIREHVPNSSQFNYVVCLVTVDGKQYLLDATEKFLPGNFLPQRCLNGNGLVLGKEGYQWINLETKMRSRVVASAEFELSPEMTLTGKVKFDNSGYAALNKRKQYFSKGQDDYVKDVLSARSSWDVQKAEIENAEQLANNFVEHVVVTVTENVTSAGDVVYIDPFVCSGYKTNPFKLEKREYPVNYGNPEEDVLTFKLTIPQGFGLEEKPENKVLSLPQNAGRFLYSVSVTGNVVQITSMVTINKSTFVGDEYPALREFYNQIVAKQAEQIVLKKL